jgi:hypothetical protein
MIPAATAVLPDICGAGTLCRSVPELLQEIAGRRSLPRLRTHRCSSCQAAQATFAGEKMDVCGASLLKNAPTHCAGEMQFFENTRCTPAEKFKRVENRYDDGIYPELRRQ